MERILGQDGKDFWHIASSTYGMTMHTLCDKWLKAGTFAIEHVESPCIVPSRTPWCTSCVFVSAIYSRQPHH